VAGEQAQSIMVDVLRLMGRQHIDLLI